ncbi:MAG: ABC transporter ATP-binding protein [Coriobacteriales bacterium]|nr:ABC transporter ATP-binding protein [Coriobacteriales bacterium]
MSSSYAIEAFGLVKKFKTSKRALARTVHETGTAHVDAEGRIVAVDTLSFMVKRGEIYGLLGPNGAGKTTTMRMLATLIKPTAGDALVAGHSIVDKPEAVRASIGFLTSELKLEDFFTPSYLFDFFSRLHRVEPQVAARRKQQMFRRFGIEDFATTKVSALSTGMRQKASIAISLVHDPDLIIFDEPTNGLDVITARVVTDYLQELRLRGKTIVLSTHIFSLAERLCDRIGVIMDGQMLAEGSLAEIALERSLEEAFFDLYVARHPEEVLL